MKIFLFLIIWADGGSRVFYEKSYTMPGWTECLDAVAAMNVNLTDQNEGDGFGVAAYCASHKVDKKTKQ